MKNKGVCTGCKYQFAGTTYPELKGACGYMDKTGSSRIKAELENGGYKKDSCICYEGKSERQQSGGIDMAGKNVYLTEKELFALIDTCSEWCSMMSDGNQEACDEVEKQLNNGLGSALKKLYKGRNGYRIYERY